MFMAELKHQDSQSQKSSIPDKIPGKKPIYDAFCLLPSESPSVHFQLLFLAVSCSFYSFNGIIINLVLLSINKETFSFAFNS